MLEKCLHTLSKLNQASSASNKSQKTFASKRAEKPTEAPAAKAAQASAVAAQASKQPSSPSSLGGKLMRTILALVLVTTLCPLAPSTAAYGTARDSANPTNTAQSEAPQARTNPSNSTEAPVQGKDSSNEGSAENTESEKNSNLENAMGGGGTQQDLTNNQDASPELTTPENPASSESDSNAGTASSYYTTWLDVANAIESGALEGEGFKPAQENDTYLLATPEAFAWWALLHANTPARLTADLDLTKRVVEAPAPTKEASTPAEAGSAPTAPAVGDPLPWPGTSTLSAKLDGANHAISLVANGAGLFAEVAENGTVAWLVLGEPRNNPHPVSKVERAAQPEGQQAEAGALQAASVCAINNGTIKGVTNFAPISIKLSDTQQATEATAAGIAATNNGTIADCANLGTIDNLSTADACATAGIAAKGTGTIRTSYNAASLQASKNAAPVAAPLAQASDYAATVDEPTCYLAAEEATYKGITPAAEAHPGALGATQLKESAPRLNAQRNGERTTWAAGTEATQGYPQATKPQDESPAPANEQLASNRAAKAAPASWYDVGLAVFTGSIDAKLEGDGTASAPYLIDTPEKLALWGFKIWNDSGSTYTYAKLTASIDLTGEAYGGTAEKPLSWSPVGNSDYPYQGSFDGAGYAITNLYCNAEENTALVGKPLGLIGAAASRPSSPEGVSVVANVRVQGSLLANTHAGMIVGSVVSVASSSPSVSVRIENCVAQGTITASETLESFVTGGGSPDMGGIVGSYRPALMGNSIQNAPIIKCTSRVDLKSGLTVRGLGGIAGAAYNVLIDQCSYEGKLQSDKGDSVGGLVGRTTDDDRSSVGGFVRITRSHAAGSIETYLASNVGGLVGSVLLNNHGSFIEDNYSSIDFSKVKGLEGTNAIGGLIGQLISLYSLSGQNLQICSNYARGAAAPVNFYGLVGGLSILYTPVITASHNYCENQIRDGANLEIAQASAISFFPPGAMNLVKTTEEMKSAALVVALNQSRPGEDAPWRASRGLAENDGYPLHNFADTPGTLVDSWEVVGKQQTFDSLTSSGALSGLGTQADPFVIYTPEAFAWWGYQVNSTPFDQAPGTNTQFYDTSVKLGASMDLTGAAYGGTAENPLLWVAVGKRYDPDSASPLYPYVGIFDGGKLEGYAVTNLNIRTNDNDQGLFGCAAGRISNLSVSGTVLAGERAGLVAGSVDGNDPTFTNCSAAGFCAAAGVAGGVVGSFGRAHTSNLQAFNQCQNTARVEGAVAGGILGENRATVDIVLTNCFNVGEITGPDIVGQQTLGGLVGLFDTPKDMGLQASYNAGKIKSATSSSGLFYSGALFGTRTTGNVRPDRIFYDYEVSGVEAVGGSGAVPEFRKSTAEMKSPEILAQLNAGNNAWASDIKNINKGYPVFEPDSHFKNWGEVGRIYTADQLRSTPVTNGQGGVSNLSSGTTMALSGTGTTDTDPLRIASPEALAWFAYMANAHPNDILADSTTYSKAYLKLEADLSLAGCSYTGIAEGSLGSDSSKALPWIPFSLEGGMLDGGARRLKYLNDALLDYAGPNSRIEYLTIDETCSRVLDGVAPNVSAGLCRTANGAKFQSCSNYAYISVVNGGSSCLVLGGLVGSDTDGGAHLTFRDCMNAGVLMLEYDQGVWVRGVGGLLGYSFTEGTEFLNSFNAGEVRDRIGRAGSLCGSDATTSMKNCFTVAQLPFDQPSSPPVLSSSQMKTWGMAATLNLSGAYYEAGEGTMWEDQPGQYPIPKGKYGKGATNADWMRVGEALYAKEGNFGNLAPALVAGVTDGAAESTAIQLNSAEQMSYFMYMVNNRGAEPIVANQPTTWKNACVKVTGNINLRGHYTNILRSMTPWRSIGLSEATAFEGTFDGGGFIIYAFSAYGSSQNASDYDKAPFGYVNNATLKNIVIKKGPNDHSTTIAGSYYSRFLAGGLVGYASGATTIQDCSIKALLETGYNTTEERVYGGIVMEASGTTTIARCVSETIMRNFSSNTANAGSALAGGIVGKLGAGCRVIDSYYSGSIDAPGALAAGVVAYNNGTVKNSYSVGTISSDFNASPFDIVARGTGTVENCYASTAYGSTTAGVNRLSPEQMASLGTAFRLNAGRTNTTDATNIDTYAAWGWSRDVNNGFPQLGGVKVTTSPSWADVGARQTADLLRRTEVVRNADGKGEIAGLKPALPSGGDYLPALSGTGTAQDPYVLACAEALAWWTYQVNNKSAEDNGAGVTYANSCVVLALDFSIGGNNYNAGSALPWVPIGNSTPYAGTFDGGGFTISSFTLKGVQQAPFLKVSGGSILNLSVGGTGLGNLNSSDRNNKSAGLVLEAENATIKNCTSSMSIDIEGAENDSGGIVYNANGTTVIEQCSFTGSLFYSGGWLPSYYGGRVGGIAAWVSKDSKVIDSYCVSPLLSAVSSVMAGVVAENAGTIQNCYSTAVIQGDHFIQPHDVVGVNSGIIENCYASTSLGDVKLGVTRLSYDQMKTWGMAALLNGRAAGPGTVWAQDVAINNGLPTPTGVITAPASADWQRVGQAVANNEADYGTFKPDLVAGATDGATPATAIKVGTAEAFAYFTYMVNNRAAEPVVTGGVAWNKACVTLTDDIDLAAKYNGVKADGTAAGATPWVPIGSTAAYYMGTFDGGGYLTSNYSLSGWQAPFNHVNNAVIKNLKTSGHVGDDGGAGIVQDATGSTQILDCQSAMNHSTNNGNSYSAGIVYKASGNVTIARCSNTGSSSRYGRYQQNYNGRVGGIVAILGQGCQVIDSYSRCSLISFGAYVGGIAAENNGVVKNSYAIIGAVSDYSVSPHDIAAVGSGSIENCYASTSLGDLKPGVTRLPADQVAMKTWGMAAALNGRAAGAGTAWTQDAAINNGLPTPTGATATLAAADWQRVGQAVANNEADYGTFKPELVVGATDGATPTTAIKVGTPEALAYFMYMVNSRGTELVVPNGVAWNKACVTLTGDIDLAAKYNGVNADGTAANDTAWIPIGTYAGVFDGVGFAISHMAFDAKAAKSALFDTITGATIKNLTIGGTVYQDNTGVSEQIAAGIAANAAGSTLITDCASTMNYTKDVAPRFGGIVYQAEGTTKIERCSFTGTAKRVSEIMPTGITLPFGYIGGITGLLKGTAIVQDCFTNSDQLGGWHVRAGGITGWSYTGVKIKNCYTYANYYPARESGGPAPIVSNYGIDPTNEKATKENCYYSAENVYMEAGITKSSKEELRSPLMALNLNAGRIGTDPAATDSSYAPWGWNPLFNDRFPVLKDPRITSKLTTWGDVGALQKEEALRRTEAAIDANGYGTVGNLRADQPSNNDYKATLSGSGTQNDPFVISTPEAFAWWTRQVNNNPNGKTHTADSTTETATAYKASHVKLDASLSLAGLTYTGKVAAGTGTNFENCLPWMPVAYGTSVANSNPYTGTFDGGENNIANFYTTSSIASMQGDYLALFRFLGGGAHIMNLYLESGFVDSGAGFAASLAGNVAAGSTTFTNCGNRGVSVKSLRYSAGLIGATNITAGSNVAVKLTRCFNNGSVESTKGNAAGLVSWLGSHMSIEDCYNAGSVSATGEGWIIASAVANDGSVSSVGSVSGFYNVGKLSAVSTNGATTIRSAGVYGQIFSGASKNWFCDKDSVAAGEALVHSQATIITSDQLKSWGAAYQLNKGDGSQSITGLTTWRMAKDASENGGFPVLINGTDATDGDIATITNMQPATNWSEVGAWIDRFAAEKKPLGVGAVATPFQIATPEHLAWFAYKVNQGTGGLIAANQNAVITAPITFDGKNYTGESSIAADRSNCLPWVPLGNEGIAGAHFYGTLEGGDHKITNVYVVAPQSALAHGFVGVMSVTASLKNLDVTATVEAKVTVNQAYVGILVGYMNSATGLVENCTARGLVTGSSAAAARCYVGGLVGQSFGTISNSVVSAGTKVQHGIGIGAGAAGGIVGVSGGPTIISNCSSGAEVITTGEEYAGGIIGIGGSNNHVVNVKDCWAAGKISGEKSKKGGVFGWAAAKDAVSNSYVNTEFVGNTTAPGGISGVSNGESITRCFYLQGKGAREFWGTKGSNPSITNSLALDENQLKGRINMTDANAPAAGLGGTNVIDVLNTIPDPNNPDAVIERTGNKTVWNVARDAEVTAGFPRFTAPISFATLSLDPSKTTATSGVTGTSPGLTSYTLLRPPRLLDGNGTVTSPFVEPTFSLTTPQTVRDNWALWARGSDSAASADKRVALSTRANGSTAVVDLSQATGLANNELGSSPTPILDAAAAYSHTGPRTVVLQGSSSYNSNNVYEVKLALNAATPRKVDATVPVEASLGSFTPDAKLHKLGDATNPPARAAEDSVFTNNGDVPVTGYVTVVRMLSVGAETEKQLDASNNKLKTTTTLLPTGANAITAANNKSVANGSNARLGVKPAETPGPATFTGEAVYATAVNSNGKGTLPLSFTMSGKVGNSRQVAFRWFMDYTGTWIGADGVFGYSTAWNIQVPTKDITAGSEAVIGKVTP